MTITNKALENLQNLPDQALFIPMGSLSTIKLFAGRGPKIHFRLQPQSTVKTDLFHEFKSGGINQTLHCIYLQIEVDIAAIIPGFRATSTVQTKISLAETVIVGEVPSVYGQMSLGE